MLLESMIDHEYPQAMKMEVEAPAVGTEQECQDACRRLCLVGCTWFCRVCDVKHFHCHWCLQLMDKSLEEMEMPGQHMPAPDAPDMVRAVPAGLLRYPRFVPRTPCCSSLSLQTKFTSLLCRVRYMSSAWAAISKSCGATATRAAELCCTVRMARCARSLSRAARLGNCVCVHSVCKLGSSAVPSSRLLTSAW